MRYKKLFLVIALCLATGSIALAHKGAKGIVKERMVSMENLAKATKNLANMVRGKVKFNKKLALKHASKMKKHSGKISTQFPNTKNSRHSKHSQALDIIWTDRNAFDQLAKDLSTRASQLEQVIASAGMPQIKEQFVSTVKICKQCHEKFRKPQ